ncbi:MAG: hypothetical protein K6356_15140 [Chloroflexus sp.]
MAANINREQVRAALAETDPAVSFYLDLTSGEVLRILDTDPSAEAEALRNQVMEGYGERFRYIPGGKTNPTDSDVQAWLEAEGLA